MISPLDVVQVALRGFIEDSFEEMQSTELALKLLDKLEVSHSPCLKSI